MVHEMQVPDSDADRPASVNPDSLHNPENSSVNRMIERHQNRFAGEQGKRDKPGKPAIAATTINPEEVTRLLLAIREGSPEAFDRLLPEVYESLKNIARSNLRRRGNKTLCTTELVHEAYLKMRPAMEAKSSVEWEGRTHFYAIASRAMRQILVDYARRQQAEKRISPQDRITLTGHDLSYDLEITEILTLNNALDTLDKANKRLRQVVEYRFFGGMKEDEIADVLDVSTRTVERDWVKARLFLHRVVYPGV